MYPGVAAPWPPRVPPLGVPAGVVRLREPRRRDRDRWSALRLGDRDHLERWEPDGDGSWTERHHRRQWRTQRRWLLHAARSDYFWPTMIDVDGVLAGQLTIGMIHRGAQHSAWVGYWVAREFCGRGVATAAVALGVDQAFGPLRLHRLEATVQPANGASRAVLEHLGFRQEGLLRRNLRVCGEWTDHLLYATTAEEQAEGAVRRLLAEGRAWLPPTADSQ